MLALAYVVVCLAVIAGPWIYLFREAEREAKAWRELRETTDRAAKQSRELLDSMLSLERTVTGRKR